MSEAGFACPVCAIPMLHIGPSQYQCPQHGPWTWEFLPPQEGRGRSQVEDLMQLKSAGPGGGSKAGRRRKKPPKAKGRPLDDTTSSKPTPIRVPQECGCGCGEMFVPRHQGHAYRTPTHRRRAEQRRRRERADPGRKLHQEEGA